MDTCPTCGVKYGWATARIRKGRMRVLPHRRAVWYRPRGQNAGQGSIRVYGWKRYGSWAACPDSYHDRFKLKQKGEPATLTTNINLHDPEAPKRAKNKSKRHKALQSKDKR